MATVYQRVLSAGLAAFFVLASTTLLQSDILFKGKQPIKIGHGVQKEAAISWTDCSGSSPETFQAPPYALDPADNCAVGPSTFGLECKGESCKVTDAEKLRNYLPGVYNGEKVHLKIQEHSVEIQANSGKSVQLEQ